MNKKILPVEDEKVLQLLYKEELEVEGYEVILAHNGKEAPLQVGKAKPDLVLLDIVMPGMDGLEVLSRIKGKDGRIPVLLHTSHPKYRRASRTRTADAFAEKSGDLGKLKGKFHQFLL